MPGRPVGHASSCPRHGGGRRGGWRSDCLGGAASRRRCARLGRLALEVTQDLGDHPGLGDEGDDPYRLAAARAHERVNLVDTADQRCPRPPQGAALEIGGRGILAGDSGVALLLAAPPPRADHAGVSAVVAHQITPRLEDVHENAGEQLLGLAGVLDAAGRLVARAPSSGKDDGTFAYEAGASVQGIRHAVYVP